AAYQRAIEVDPNYVHAYCGLGNLLTNDEARAGEAEAAFRRAIEVRPTYAYAWRCLGRLLAKDEARASEAETAFRRAIELDPTDAFAWLALGIFLASDDARAREAEAAYRHATVVNPSEALSWNLLAWSLYQPGRRDSEAEAAARKAVELQPHNPLFVHTLAMILVAQRDWSGAAVFAKQFLADLPMESQDEAWPDILAFFREAAAAGYAAQSVELLDECGAGDRWRPLREALATGAAGNRAYLRRVAPEVREPAEAILDELYPDGLD
ncbi:MAG: tetratricopeptide repeat protein, partial [Isosphaeraceae bacterium]|nr:tetratricopeptide repeat protein [Isosphaeraceae bacterium]